MFPDWFTKWNRDNPKNIFGPAVVLGTIGGAVVVAALIVSYGQPFATASIQTGPRGTGMSVTKPISEIETIDPSIIDYLNETAIIPVGDEVLARDAYENAEPLLGDLTVENYDRLIAAMRIWTGIDDLFGGEENYQTVVARRMIQMTQHINEEWSGHVGETGVNCFTCHRGETVPSDIWFRIDPVSESVAGWAAVQNRVTAQSSSTSLPSDALYYFLLEDNEIKVHDLEPRVASEEGLPTWQNTERTYSLMNYFANSLNVNCVFCHDSRAFYDTAEVTPQWAPALLGIDMVQAVNQDFLVPLATVYPEDRLGPVHADAPKAACATCHKGYSKPLEGLDMISNWPELAAEGPPVYE